MIDQRLTQKQLQKLSPQQIQLMKLLQVPTANLEQRIQEELEMNPALEEIKGDETEEEFNDSSPSTTDEAEEEAGDKDEESEEEIKEEVEEVSLDEYIEDYLDDDDEIAAYKLQANNYSQDEEEKTIPIAVENSLHDFLEEQVGLLDLTEHEEKIAFQIIGSVDDDGYLRRDVLALTDDLAFSQGVYTDEAEVLEVLAKVQRFDPPGIAARDLQECLLIQLQRLIDAHEGAPKKDAEKYAYLIIKKYFDEFTKKHYTKLQRQLGVDETILKKAIDTILHLNPKPASGYTSPGKSRGSVHYIVPDFTIQNAMGELELTINSRNSPDLRVNDYYREMLKTYVGNTKKTKPDREAILFIKQKIDSAKWFIDAIRQRQETMFNTMYAILQYQREFFLTGDEKKIRPMILKDVADITGLDISTVSRVANSKYVQTEFGTKRLKEFFSESLQTDSGEEVSTLEVKNILVELIKGESKKKPISDEKLKDVLQERGYNIARRTVAKYREQLGIAVARLRKEL